MKRLSAALFLALLVALVGASGVAGADPPNDFTTGGGKVERTRAGGLTIDATFSFSAYDEDDSASTAAAHGHFVYQGTTTTPSSTSRFYFKGSVDCLTVFGNQAAFRGLIEQSSNPLLEEGWYAHFNVVDNDSIGTPDQFGLVSISNPETICGSSEGNSNLADPITSGNILVSDAQ